MGRGHDKHGVFHSLAPEGPSARVASDEPRTTLRVQVPRFFLVQQNLESPIRVWLECRVPARHPVEKAELTHFARRFVLGYPDKQAYWEPLNNGLVAAVLARFPHVEHVKSVFQVGSSDEIPMVRESHVAQTRGQPRTESFEFLATRLQLLGLPGQVFDLNARIDYVPGATDYPDYRVMLDTCIASLQEDVRTGGDEIAPALARLQRELRRAFPIVGKASMDLSKVGSVPSFARSTIRHSPVNG
jgi:hypothetical protein